MIFNMTNHTQNQTQKTQVQLNPLMNKTKQILLNVYLILYEILLDKLKNQKIKERS